MRDIFVLLTKWITLFTVLYFAAIFITAIGGENSGDMVMGAIIFAVLYFPYYITALFPAYLLSLNEEHKSFLIYIIILLVSIAGITFAFIASMDDLLFVLCSSIPFVVVFIRTLYHWYLE